MRAGQVHEDALHQGMIRLGSAAAGFTAGEPVFADVELSLRASQAALLELSAMLPDRLGEKEAWEDT